MSKYLDGFFSDIAEGDRKPVTPSNIRVEKQKNGLRITWDAPEHPVIPIAYYSIEYQTVAGWIPLHGAQRIVDRNYFLWKTYSYGPTYRFRVTNNIIEMLQT